MKKKQTLGSRPADETTEGGRPLESDVPSSRFQATQQEVEPVAETQKAGGVEPNGFVATTPETKGSQLKQEQVAKVITGVGGVSSEEGVVNPSKSGLRTLAYSGNEGTILGSPSGTPVVGTPSRSDTRPGQKMDAVAKAIDYIASEQVLQRFDGSKPLQDNPSEVQGFLGHPENNGARTQKIAEAVPGALLYSRSCDEILRDEIVFSQGQMIRESNINYEVEPTLTYSKTLQELIPFSIVKGNYVPKTLHIGVKSGKLVAMGYDVDDISVTGDAAVVNASSSAFIREMNQAEINRQNIEKKAGVETEKNWCPLARAVAQPTQTVGFLGDDECITGTEMFMAYRFVNKAHSYFFNKAAKDGQTPYRSFDEMLSGAVHNAQEAAEFNDKEYHFMAAEYAQGAPSLMITLYDSIAKYSKRGDLVTQPRSWKMHKQTADNNINPFRLEPNFAKYVVGRDVFSTIDRGYDPMLPVCISDNWRVSHVYNFDDLCHLTNATRFVVQMGGHGVTLAGTAFNDIYDDAQGKLADLGSKIVLKWFASNTDGSEVYSGLGTPQCLRPRANYVAFATDKTGNEDADEALAAAIELSNSLLESNAAMRYSSLTVLYKVAVDGGVDKVYALCYFPGITEIETSANVHLLIAHSTTADHLNSDTSTSIVINKSLVLENMVFTYKYQNRQNPYVVEVRNPLLYSIREWATQLAPKLCAPTVSNRSAAMSTLADDQGVIWYHIPVVHSTTSISLWDLIICASVPFAQKIRTNSHYDTLGYMDANGDYPYAQLSTLAELNPLAAVNYGMVDILKPLTVGQMKPAVALTWIMPEKFWRIDHTETTEAITSETFVAPYYISEDQFNYVEALDSIVMAPADEGFVMNYPTTRAGARSAYLDDFYGMTERDVRLSLDIMTRLPAGYETTSAYNGAYKYGLSNSGIPVVTYSNGLTVDALLKTPRELGFGVVAPLGYNHPNSAKYISGVFKASDYATLNDLVSFGSSFRIRTWHVQGGEYKTLHDATQLVITRGGNFAQDWVMREDAVYGPIANSTIPGYGALNQRLNIGIGVNFNDVMEVSSGVISGESGASLFHPFTDGMNHNNSGLPGIITMQNVLWARVQVLPFALSPFDQTPEGRFNTTLNTNVSVDMTADPYDFMYVFGFCGFKGSDYREDMFNRIYARQTLGWTFVKDPFVEESPVLK